MLFRRDIYRSPSSRARFSQRVSRLFSLMAVAGFILIVAGILFFVIWGIHGFLFRSEYFAIRKMSFYEVPGGTSGRLGEDREALLGDFGVLTKGLRSRLRKAGLADGNLLALDKALVVGILEGHSEVAEAEVEKHYPGALEIRLRRRVPVCLVPHEPLLSMDDSIWAIDREGYVVRTLTTRDVLAGRLPFVTGIDTRESLEDGRLSSESLTRAVRLLSLLRRGAPSIWSQTSEVNVSRDGALTLVLMGGTEVFFGARSLPKQLAELDTLLASDPSQPESSAYIDLRVAGQISRKRKPSLIDR